MNFATLLFFLTSHLILRSANYSLVQCIANKETNNNSRRRWLLYLTLRSGKRADPDGNDPWVVVARCDRPQTALVRRSVFQLANADRPLASIADLQPRIQYDYGVVKRPDITSCLTSEWNAPAYYY